MSDPHLIVTMDGPLASGKSTIARMLAQKLNIPYLDTGAMYRTVAYLSLQRGVELTHETEVARVARSLDFRFGWENQTSKIEFSEFGGPFHRLGHEIRSPEVSLAASKIALLKKVREILVSKQQKIGAAEGAVVEGRDAGTVIFPKALYKFFVTASEEVRAKRRFNELQEKLGDMAPLYQRVLDDLRARDKQDSERAISPLKPAPDAMIVDTSGLNLNEVLHILCQRVQSKA